VNTARRPRRAPGGVVTTARPDIRLPPDLDDAHERALIGEVLDLCGFGGLRHAVDYGCGRGRWIWPLAARSEAVTGIDCEQSYLDTIAAIAQANRRALQLIAAPTLRPLADASVDGIISIGTLPVVRAGELWHDFFDQAARVLRPQGRILLNTFCAGFGDRPARALRRVPLCALARPPVRA
jgi:cyclopropane fatty-acyl-phospholipid synthase-like methyltransferase